LIGDARGGGGVRGGAVPGVEEAVVAVPGVVAVSGVVQEVVVAISRAAAVQRAAGEHPVVHFGLARERFHKRDRPGVREYG